MDIHDRHAFHMRHVLIVNDTIRASHRIRDTQREIRTSAVTDKEAIQTTRMVIHVHREVVLGPLKNRVRILVRQNHMWEARTRPRFRVTTHVETQLVIVTLHGRDQKLIRPAHIHKATWVGQVLQHHGLPRLEQVVARKHLELRRVAPLATHRNVPCQAQDALCKRLRYSDLRRHFGPVALLDAIY